MYDDYIKRQEALDVIQGCEGWDENTADTLISINGCIERIPAAAVADVVHCRNCVYWKVDPDICTTHAVCIHPSALVDAVEESYCSYGIKQPEVNS